MCSCGLCSSCLLNAKFVKLATASVVKLEIYVRNVEKIAEGSGFYLNDTHIITCAHCCCSNAEGARILVRQEGFNVGEGKVLKIDFFEDIALLAVHTDNVLGVKHPVIRKSIPFEEWDFVTSPLMEAVVVGYPGLSQSANLTKGMLSNVNTYVKRPINVHSLDLKDNLVYITDASGAAGCPVFCDKKIIGMYSENGTVGFLVNNLPKFLDPKANSAKADSPKAHVMTHESGGGCFIPFLRILKFLKEFLKEKVESESNFVESNFRVCVGDCKCKMHTFGF